jgi:hypothetical protein
LLTTAQAGLTKRISYDIERRKPVFLKAAEGNARRRKKKFYY